MFRELRRTGDPEIRNRLISSCYALGVNFAHRKQKQYRRYYIPLEDLVQCAQIGIIRAVDRFDPDNKSGATIATYAQHWMRSEVDRYIHRNMRSVWTRIQGRRAQVFGRLREAHKKLREKGEEPTPENIARELGVKEKFVVQVLDHIGPTDYSLDTPIPGTEGKTYLDALVDYHDPVDNLLEREELRQLLLQFVDRLDLTDRQEAIVHRRLLAEDPMTLKEVGDLFGLSRERIRQLENRLLGRLREMMDEELEPRTLH